MKKQFDESFFGNVPPLSFETPSVGRVVENRGDAGEDSQVTGVARYLQKLEPKAEEVIDGEQLTGVAKYLAQQQALEEANKPVVAEVEAEVLEVAEAAVEVEPVSEPVPSGVEKYISQQNENPITRVAKYLLKQSILSREIPVTGVSKYVTRHEHDGHVVTGVAKYVTQQGMRESMAPSVTGVAKYVLKSELQAKDAPVATGVEYVSSKNLLAGCA